MEQHLTKTHRAAGQHPASQILGQLGYGEDNPLRQYHDICVQARDEGWPDHQLIDALRDLAFRAFRDYMALSRSHDADIDALEDARNAFTLARGEIRSIWHLDRLNIACRI